MPIIKLPTVDQGVTLAALFKNPDGVPTDPTTVTLRIKVGLAPSVDHVYGTDQDVKKTGTGAYEYDFLLEEAGVVKYRWIGKGTVAAASGSSILVWPAEA